MHRNPEGNQTWVSKVWHKLRDWAVLGQFPRWWNRNKYHFFSHNFLSITWNNTVKYALNQLCKLWICGPMPAPESLPVPQEVESMCLETCSDETLPWHSCTLFYTNIMLRKCANIRRNWRKSVQFENHWFNQPYCQMWRNHKLKSTANNLFCSEIYFLPCFHK